MTSRRRTLGSFGLTTAVVAALAVTTATTIAATAMPGRGPGTGSVADDGDRPIVGSVKATDDHESTSVTLINGDRVLVTGADTPTPTVAVLPREDGSVPVTETRSLGKDLYVYPAGVAAALASGLVDEELFNVTGLIRQGYDDASTDSIPLIAQYADSVGTARGAPATPRGSTAGPLLASIDAMALSATKKDAATFWADVTNPRSRAGGQIEKIWLDRQVSATLDQSTKQIGAPVAWAAGLDGAGTTVAVLDSGVDAGHPDLADRIVDKADFTGSSPEAADGHGHGTHVASTVAGSGAASDGLEKGVAPGAKLLIGKVLTDSGFGASSAIIAGMQWAVEQDPDVISMSLGSEQATSTCADPIALATASLAASSNSLFVVAAGNIGPRVNTISSPACVPEVLTVGAVSGEDATADFSSRGPVAGTHALKPEIAGPGVGILAAATGGRGVYAYRTMSGTSMATPHVAGAAAILRQRHPDWTPARLKAALVSSSQSDISGDVRETGAGRLDLPAALDPTIIGAPAIQVGTFAWPQAGVPRSTASVPYTNLSDVPLELDLSIERVTGHDGSAIRSRIATLADRSVKVLAGETIEIPLTFDPGAKLSPGQYGDITGRIIAQDAETGRRLVSTPFAAYVEPRTVTLTIKLIDRTGAPAASISTVDVLNLDTVKVERRFNAGAAVQQFSLRPGSYFISSFIGTPDSADPVSPLDSATYLARPQFELTGDTTVVLDARRAHKVSVRTDRPSEARVTTLAFTRAWDEVWRHTGSLTVASSLEETYVDVPGRARDGDFEFGHYSRRYAPAIGTLRAVDARLTLHPQAPNLSSVGLDGSGTTQLVDGGSGTPAELAAAGVAGKIVLVKVAQTFLARTVMRAAAEAGAKAVLLYRAAPGRWVPTLGFEPATLAIYTLPGDEGAALAALLADGPVTLAWSGTASSPYVYNLAFHAETLSAPRTFSVRDKALGRAESTYTSMGVPWTIVDTMEVRRPIGSAFATSNYEAVTVPGKRTELYTGGGTTWRHGVRSGLPYGETVMDPFRSYAKKTFRTERWYDGTIAPTAAQTDSGELQLAAERQGNMIGFASAIWGDSFGHWVQASSFGDFGNLELFREGTSVGYSVFPSGAFDVPAEDSSYELVQNVFKDEFATPNWKRSMWVTTRWHFRSHLDDSAYSQGIPIIFPRLDLPEDGLKTLPAAKGIAIPLRITGHAGYAPGAIRSAKVSWSYDGGATWTDGVARRGHSGWVAVVDHTGASGKQVMLRIEIEDDKAAAVTQTITRAYDVR